MSQVTIKISIFEKHSGHSMMTSSNRNIFRVTGHLCGEFPVPRSFDVFFDLRLNKRLSKQSWGWWFETVSRPLWRHCNGSPRECYLVFIDHITSMLNRIHNEKAWSTLLCNPSCSITNTYIISKYLNNISGVLTFKIYNILVTRITGHPIDWQ